jgi:hypothetical protein
MMVLSLQHGRTMWKGLGQKRNSARGERVASLTKNSAPLVNPIPEQQLKRIVSGSKLAPPDPEL